MSATELPKTGDAFLDRIAAEAIKSQRNTGVPASVTMAQALLESDRGRSGLSKNANNFFGIKGTGPAGSVTLPTQEVYNGRTVTVNAKFRKYDSPSQSFDDHGKFLLKNSRYKPAFNHTGDGKQFAREIHKAGYATDPKYSDKLIKIMNEYGLERFDKIARSGQQVGTDKPATQFPAFDGKYTPAPSLDQVKPNQNLKIGHEGPAVELVQKQLHKLGYLSDADMKSGNGKFGPKTRAAVDQFQRDHKLTPPKGQEGQVGPTTLAWLKNDGKKPVEAGAPAPRPGGTDGMDGTAKPAPAKPTQQPAQPAAFDGKYTQAPSMEQVKKGQNLKIGHEGPAVEQAQNMLAKLGYLSGTGAETPDGKFGPKTREAVARFQQDRQLKPAKGHEGELGPTTLQMLEKAVAAEAPAPPRPGKIAIAPANLSMKEKYAYYANMVRANGGKVNPNGQATVLGIRGMDANGKVHPTTINKNYDDMFVVLKPNGTVAEFRGSTHSNPRYQGRAPDANRDGRGDLGMIRPGNYSVVPNGNYIGAASYHVRTEGGSGSLPAYRDTDQSNTISQAEREAAKARGYKQTEILFHRAGSNDNGSMGCQTIASSDYDRFIQAVGGARAAYNYSLVDANGDK
ncbi:MAG TPA: glucosaminidase domain-containing protein [Myxococcaceae bacterium]